MPLSSVWKRKRDIALTNQNPPHDKGSSFTIQTAKGWELDELGEQLNWRRGNTYESQRHYRLGLLEVVVSRAEQLTHVRIPTSDTVDAMRKLARLVGVPDNEVAWSSLYAINRSIYAVAREYVDNHRRCQPGNCGCTQ
jgi:hypothetical protein